MAFRNSEGLSISYDALTLIEELKLDIEEFGADYEVYVIVEQRHGVLIYKDYLFPETGGIELNEGEYTQKITMGDLLAKYEEENSIL